MQKKYARVEMKLWLPAAVCLAAAAVLLVAAFTQPKQDNREQWTPLNDEVELALKELELDASTSGEEAAGSNNDAGGAHEGEEIRAVSDEAGKTGSVADADVAQADSELIIEEDHTGKLDINRATAEELDELKGIGPAKAQAIVEDREKNGSFATVNDLLRVRGIGEKLLAGMKEGIVARP
ncbi:ComEA family DNA-binding protein [Paenibacillus sp. YIM B09110]|uniref:ComEA family DNA-binding protein n=1 Tax=Paenibacillus sp. YIM B09110 TaxID=3126102 RepID=UPI00301D9859